MERAPNIRHLAAMAATVRHGAVTRAAKAVNLTQPALTQAIARLESTLDVRLFERGPQGMTPTDPALLLAPRVERALERIGSPRVTGTQVRAFVALARAGSWGPAAHATGLSAAALHRAVADLSLALGQRLVERRGRGVVLTPAGQRRARGFGLALAELRAGYAEVAEWQGRAGGRIVIGAMPLSRARWLPETIARFAPHHPEAEIAVIEGSYAELAGPLRDGEIDVLTGALREEVDGDDLAQERVFTDRPAVIMRRDHPLADPAATFDAAALGRYEWILPNPETPLRHYWEEMATRAGTTPPKVRIECGSVLTIRQLLLSGDWLTLLSPDQLAFEIDAGVLAVRPPPAPVTREIGLVTREGWRPTGTQAAFVEALRAAGRGLGR